ncbi:MAG: PRD domain-containing protein [Vagococcus sp.]
MYRIVQVLNNNVAIVKKDGKQEIAMGKGIVFQKKKGDILQASDIQRLFVVKDEESKKNFSLLLKDVPLDFITTTHEIIENAINEYGYSVQDYIYVTLTDHIYWNYKRLEKGEYIKSLLPEISEQYPTEYQIAKDALMIINSRLGVTFPIDEIKNISLHFVNAQAKIGDHENKHIVFDSLQIVYSKVENILKEQQIYRNTNNQNFYDRLMIHLRYTLDRTEPIKEDEFAIRMEQELIKSYPKAYRIAEDIYNVIKNETGLQLNTSEKVYFTIHLQRLF